MYKALGNYVSNLAHTYFFHQKSILLKYQCITQAVWPRKSVFWSTRFSNGTNSPSYTLLYRQNFGRVCSIVVIEGWCKLTNKF